MEADGVRHGCVGEVGHCPNIVDCVANLVGLNRANVEMLLAAHDKEVLLECQHSD